MSMSLRCPSHPEANLIEDHRAGDVICPECGLVVGDRLAFETLWLTWSPLLKFLVLKFLCSFCVFLLILKF